MVNAHNSTVSVACRACSVRYTCLSCLSCLSGTVGCMGPHDRHLSAVPGTHEGMPERGSFRREHDGKEVDPPQAWDFPVLATCRTCGQTIRRRDGLLANWVHVWGPGGRGGLGARGL